MRWVQAGFLAIGLIAVPVRAATRPPSIDQLFAAYVGGDRDVVARTLTRPQDFPASGAALDSVLLRWRKDWRPARVAFLLEVAVAASTVLPSDRLESLLSSGAAFVMARPKPPGADANEDHIEIVFHRAALGLIEQRQDGSAIEAYVDALERRFSSVGDSPGRSVDSRALLARAIARAECCAGLVATARRDETTRWDGAADANTPRRVALAPHARRSAFAPSERFRDALQQFDRAAAFADTRPEALVRGAYLLFAGNQLTQALDRLDRFGSRDPDDDLTYWAYLLRGRILDELERHADAERAYRAALDARPAGQSAGIGLALDLMRLGRPDEAEAVATLVRTAPAHAADPWWTFDDGDARFVPAWRDELRRVLR